MWLSFKLNMDAFSTFIFEVTCYTVWGNFNGNGFTE